MAAITTKTLTPKQDKPAPASRTKSDPDAAKAKLEQALRMVGPRGELNTLLNEAIELL